ncbi:T9SS type A sorting domain-containing protein [Adhaeribacter pallidiroseus]|uniref:Secretion system C-terminal sorting domain-containing protein n=1 Tax=Adhaeribacter pallidiroseus TaxID=2072847 RepID=A0A369QRR8_9BACT|nr:T9SS type A sorting domain-containing protein [Adhaeribacter pallidiroseus]RDC64878.1 hypothetical protein AHMF7616_03500 [Adhaeribacter pallidiroseus]
MKQTQDGGYILGGSSSSGKGGYKSESNRGTNGYSLDYWVVKTDSTYKKAQTITFDPIPDQIISETPLTLTAKASSGLPITYTLGGFPETGATLINNRLIFKNPGGIWVTASQAGNAEYGPAVRVFQFFKVIAPVTKNWDRTLGGNKEDRLSTSLATPDGGYLLGGSSISDQSNDKSQTNTGGQDFWVVKTDSLGQKVWDKTYGGLANEELKALVATPDGGYLLAGTTFAGTLDDLNLTRRPTADYWVVKITTDGTQLWEKTFGGSLGDALAAVTATPDGGFLLGGTSVSGTSRDKTEASRDLSPAKDYTYQGDYWLVKINSQGQKLWDITLGGPAADNLSEILATPDGNYLLAGYSNSSTGGDKTAPNASTASSGNQDFWILKINAQGQKIWDKGFGDTALDYYVPTIIATTDGNYLLGGRATTGKKSYQSVFKLDPQGNKIWQQQYDFGGGVWNNLRSRLAMINTPDGRYLLAGSSNPYATFTQYRLQKIDANGIELWGKQFGSDNSYLDSYVADLKITPDGGYLLSGWSNSDSTEDKSAASKGGFDYWVIKLKDLEPPVLAAWDYRYGSAAADNFTTVIKTNDGGYLAGGYSAGSVGGDKTQFGQGSTDFWIVKTNAAGKKLWDKRYGGTGHDYLNRLIATKDGGYLLGGSSFSGNSGDKTQGSRGDRDYWVVKIDAAGNKQWDKRFGGSGSDELKKVMQLTTGEYVLGGYSNSPVSGDKTQTSQGGTDYWLVKISSTGDKIWDKRYGGALNETLSGFVQTWDGGFLLGGSSLSGVGGDKTQASQGESDFWLVQIDKNGTKRWDKRFGGSGQDQVFAVGQVENDFFISGQSNSPANGDKTQTSQGGQDFWLVKVSATGGKLWDKRYGGDKDDELRAAIQQPQGGFVLAGTSYSGVSGDKTQASQGNSDYWLVQVDANGHLQKDFRYGGTGAEDLRTVLPTTDGGYLLGGRSDSGISGDRNQSNQGLTDYWLVKVAPDSSSTGIIASRAATVFDPVVAPEQTSILAHPNPFGEQVVIRFILAQTQLVSLQAYDSQGRPVATIYQGQITANKTTEQTWQPAPTLANGVYLLRLQTQSKVMYHKVLLSR